MDPHMGEGAGGGPQAQDVPEHPEELKNETPSILVHGFHSVIQMFEAYGWFLLLGVIALVVLWMKLEPYIRNMKQKKEEQEYLNIDPETALQRQEAMHRARQRLQEQHDAEAARFAEEKKKKEEQKRQEKIEDWERHQRGEGYRSKVKVQEPSASTSTSQPKNKKPVYRTSDYNPLTGTGGGEACYRPARRGGAGGG